MWALALAIAEIVFNAAMVHWENHPAGIFSTPRAALLGSPGFTLTAVLTGHHRHRRQCCRLYPGEFCVGKAAALS